MVSLVHPVYFTDGETEAQTRRLTCPRFMVHEGQTETGILGSPFFHKQILGAEPPIDTWGCAVPEQWS